MKIKIMDDFVHEYEDVTQGKVYEVVEECLMDYVIIDDQFDRNAILKEHCEIVELKEDSVKEFKVGDRVVFINADFNWCGDQYTVTKTGDGDTVEVLSDIGTQHYFLKFNLKLLAEDPANKQTVTCDLQQILNFTRDMKGFEVSFEEGKVTVKDWNVNYDCIEYVLDSIDDLEPMMESLSHIQSFKK